MGERHSSLAIINLNKGFYMKNYKKDLFFAVMMSLLSEIGLSTQVAFTRCNEDLINHGDRNHVRERWEWSKKWHEGKWTKNLRRFYNVLEEDLADWHDPNALGPYYPVYSSEDNSQVWVAPKDRNAPESQPPFPWKIGVCQGGCLLGDQLILFSDGYYKASEAMKLKKADLVTLDENSTTDNLLFKETSVKEYKSDINPKARNTYLTLTTNAGSKLKVTPTHPLINGSGTMVRAKELKVGETLLHVSGEVHQVTRIESNVIEERVINVQPATRSETRNVYVVQGYLSGSSSQQDRDLSEVNRYLFREQLGDIMIP
jgi:hypothetical protein